MNCNKVIKLLPLYMSDDLDRSDLDGVRDHLGNCLGCFREYQSHLRARRSLLQLKVRPNLSPVMKGFTSEVMQKIAEDATIPPAPVPRVIYAFAPRVLAAAALILALITAGTYLFDDGSDAKSVPERNTFATTPQDEPAAEPFGFEPVYVVVDDPLDPEASGEKRTYPDLEPLPRQPQVFPVVQPASNKRNF